MNQRVVKCECNCWLILVSSLIVVSCIFLHSNFIFFFFLELLHEIKVEDERDSIQTSN